MYGGYKELPANIIDNLLKENKGIIYSGLYIPGKKWLTFSFISPNVQKLLGYSSEELQKMPGNGFNIIHPDDKGKAIKLFRELNNNGKPKIQIIRVLEKNTHKYIRLEEYVFPQNINNEIVGFWGYTFKVSEILESEKRLFGQEKGSKNIINYFPFPLIVIDSKWNIVGLNKTALNLIQVVKLEEAIDKSFLEFVTNSYKRKIKTIFSQVLKGKKNKIEFEIIGWGKLLLMVKANLIPIEQTDNNINRILITCEDVIKSKNQLEDNFDSHTSDNNKNTFVYELDENYIITHVTSAIKDIYGISDQEAIGKSAFEVFASVNNKKIKSHLTKFHLKSLSDIYYNILETEILPKKKKKFLIQDIAFFLRDSDKFIGIKGIVNDISSKQNVKLKTHEDSSKLNSDFDKLVGYWKFNYKENCLFWDESFFRILELNPNSILPTTKTYIPFIFQDDKEMVNFAFINAVKNKKPININHRIKLKNGNIKYVNLQGLTDYNENGNPLKSIGVLIEISKNNFNEENISTNKFKFDKKLYKSSLSEEGVKILTEKTNTLIVRLNRDLRIIYRNATASFRLGVIVGELLGKTICDLDFTDKEKSIWIRLLSSVFTEKREKNFVIKLSNDLWIDWTIVPELGMSGKVEFLLLFGHDITERKKIEEVIAKSLKKERETNKLISNFITTLSHEVRGPIATIALSTEILELYHNKLNEKQRANHFRSIGRAIDNLTSMINEIITLNEIKNQRTLKVIKKVKIINFCKNLIKEIYKIFYK